VGHPNSPLTPEGRRRLCEWVDAGRPIAHVAEEAGISRQCLAKWYARWQQFGEQGLLDQSSRPGRSPTAISDDIVDAILELRRAEKWGASRIAAHLAQVGIDVAPVTVHRTLVRHDLSRVRDMDPPTGELLRGAVQRYEHERCGDMVHVDVKKIGQIPRGGGWAIHGKGTEAARASKRKGRGTGKVGYTYVHSAVDDYSRLAYSEPLADEKGDTAAAWWDRAVGFFAEYGIHVIERVLTDNGSCYRSRVWADALGRSGSRHRRTRPYTPKTNGKVERYNGTLIAEWARRRPYDSEADRCAALVDFLNYNNERPHSAIGHVPPRMRTPGSGFTLAQSRIEEETLEMTPEQFAIFDAL
jgi:transposase InsO family protein